MAFRAGLRSNPDEETLKRLKTKTIRIRLRFLSSLSVFVFLSSLHRQNTCDLKSNERLLPLVHALKKVKVKSTTVYRSNVNATTGEGKLRLHANMPLVCFFTPNSATLAKILWSYDTANQTSGIRSHPQCQH